MPRVVLADADAPVHRQRHDQDQPLQAIRVPQRRILQFKTPALEIGEQRLNRPTCGIVQHRRPRWGAVHGDDPGLWVARLVEDADVGHNALREQAHPRQIALNRASRQLAGGGLVAMARIRQQVALQPQAVAPPVGMEPAEQIR